MLCRLSESVRPVKEASAVRSATVQGHKCATSIRQKALDTPRKWAKSLRDSSLSAKLW